MGKANRVLLMLIAMVAIMITAVGINKVMEHYSTAKWVKEQRERCEETRADVAQIQMTISELSQDQQALEEFIKENEQYFEDSAQVYEEDRQDSFGDISETVHEGDFSDPNISGNSLPEDIVSGNDLFAGDVSENDVSGNQISEHSISENSVSENSVSGNSVSGNSVSGNSVSGNSVSGNSVSENSVSGDSESGNSVSGNSVSGNSVSGNTVPGKGMTESFMSHSGGLENQKKRGSYEETILQNKYNQEIIKDNGIDFSDKKIVCLGDSITAATNLEDMEDYQQYSYPAYLKEFLGAGSVENLGIGGSSIGRYWENAFVDRYKDIPQDADIILVMGGTNDGFCVSQEEFGTMEEREERTFIGDLDELMRGLKEDYPEAKIIFVTPLPNVLHDMLRKERDYLLPQFMIANAMKMLGEEYEIPVIDLYGSNLLDSHDAAVIYNYMPDGVHCNQQGYKVLAGKIAAELISLYEMQEDDIEEEL